MEKTVSTDEVDETSKSKKQKRSKGNKIKRQAPSGSREKIRAGKKKRKHVKSFRLQITFSFIALTAFCILLSIFISNLLFERYYGRIQVNMIEDTFDDINEYSVEQGVINIRSNLFAGNVTYGDIERGENISNYYKYDALGNYWVNSMIETELDKMSLKDNLSIMLYDPLLWGYSKYVYNTASSDDGLDRMIESMREYILYDITDAETDKLVDSSDRYKIYRSSDRYTSSENYDLIGKLDNGVYCFIRANYDTIAETAAVSNNFFAYVGVGVILVEALFIFLISKTFTRPLKDMNEVAKRMASLDFDAKASVDTGNEFGELAGSLNELSERLEKTILELKTANNELRTDLDRRVEIDDMRRDFLGNVSHELKTPIAIIQGYAEGLKDNVNEDAESRDFYCDVIMDEASKMNAMVKNLLSLNRIEYGESQLEMERFDVAELIKGLLQSASVLAGEKEVRIIFNAEEPHFVFADEYMAEEAISNYISNAFHYVSGENIIEVTLTENDGRLRVSVFNSGSTIPEEDLDKVWIKFYKVDKARTREYGGSGIGLSLVKAIMELHHQQCGVLNRDGGVEFWLELDSSPEVE